MNITIISNILPYPLVSGGAQAQFNMIDELRKKHNISFIFTEDGKNKRSAMKKLKKMWPEVNFYLFSYARQLCYPKFLYEKARRAIQLKFIPNNLHFQIERTIRPYGVEFSHDFISFVNRIIKQNHTDIIQVEFFPCLHIVNYLPKDIKKIFIHHEIRYVRNRRLLKGFKLSNKEKKQLDLSYKTEIYDLNQYDSIITLTEQDKKILEQDGVISPIHISPAAVNTEVLPYQEWNGNISFVGGYAHIPNQEGIEWFIDNVLPLLDNNIHLDIVGGGWPSYYSKNNISLKGFVDNLAQNIHGSIMIVPILTGSGMRMKILEAAAMSLPFVTTSIGVEGLNFKDHESCLIADTPEDFAQSIIKLSMDAKLRKSLAERANLIFKNQYSKKVLADVRDDTYLKILQL